MNMMEKPVSDAGNTNAIRVAWAAHKGTGRDTGKQAAEFIRQWLDPDAFEMTDRHPDIILFMSGGSERMAISLTEPGHPVMLLSIPGNNAYAAATEVMAWMVENNRYALLSDAKEAFESGLVGKWRQTIQIWRSMSGKNAGLIGFVSDWLVASDVPAERFRQLMGVTLETIPWRSLPDYREQDPDPTLLLRFNGYQAAGLADASKVLTVLRQTIAKENLSAIAVECFSLVQQRQVTACLALAQLNTEGKVAACEGDLASMAGMMLLQAVSGSVPWMANTTGIQGNRLVLSHCTAAFNLVRDVKLATHYETDCSLAVKGFVTASEVTLFRFSGSLDKAFICEGRVTGHPALNHACRTQVEIELPESSVALLRNRPLGNHLIMAPGKYAELLRLACQYKEIYVQN
jgi:L-fucose isomerase-like protein